MGKTELEEGTVNAVAPYRMWRALQLAETASRAGIVSYASRAGIVS